MTIQTYSFYETGRIDGVPGEFYVGQIVDVDTVTKTIVGQRRMSGIDVVDKDPQPTDDEPAPVPVELPLDSASTKYKYQKPLRVGITPIDDEVRA